MENNIIFLDIDGVLTSARTGWLNMDPFSVTFIKWICKQANIQVVISSTWRCNRDRKFFSDIFGEEIIHYDWRTPWDLSDFTMNCRGDEIQKWLDNHPEVERYLIIDDDNDMLDHQKQFLRLTSTYNGIQFDDQIFIRDFFDCQVPCNMNLHTICFHPNLFHKDIS